MGKTKDSKPTKEAPSASAGKPGAAAKSAPPTKAAADAKAAPPAKAAPSAKAAARQAAAPRDDEPEELSFVGQIIDDARYWLKTQGLFWATSVVGHAVVLAGSLLLMGTVAEKLTSEAPAFEEAKVDTPPDTEIKEFEVGETSIEPTELTTETLTLNEAPTVEQAEQVNGSPDEAFSPAGGGMASGTSAIGGLGGFDVRAIGPGSKVRGPGGIGTGIGSGNGAGSGGSGMGFGGRGSGVRQAMLASGGGTKASERAVAAALNWLARHQNPDGGWGIGSYPHNCKDPSCAVGTATKGNANASDMAGTAMAILPFLAAGQTHKTNGPYQKNIFGGLYWMLKHQKNDGDCRGAHNLYAHGLSTITLCEAYGLSGDKQIGAAAQQAINFIVKAQNQKTGGWRYVPGDEGDTSVVGWQLMGLKSGLMAGLSVPSPTIEGAARWCKSCAGGKAGGLFGYVSKSPTMSMTAVGLLCTQYLGAQRTDPNIQEGMKYLMAHLPTEKGANAYYWYYATQVMHNLPGYEWDQWNRTMRRILIDTQAKEGCAAGSWDATKHSHGEAGGRIMVTSFCCLTLEVYYRYLPLYSLDGGGKHAAPGGQQNALKDDLAPVGAGKK